jgi:hypothetical protein
LKRWKTKYYVGLAIFVISWILWPIAITHASASHFTEDELAVQLMVLGGAVAVIFCSVTEMWD